MDVNRINQSVYKKRKREHGDDEDMSIGSMDSYSDRSLESDEFLNIKKEYLQRKKNLNRDCCRETLDCQENYFLMKLHEEQIEQIKLEKKI